MTILALDFGGTQIKSALIGDDFDVIKELPTYASPNNLESLLTLIDTIVNPILEEIDGLAISCPGTVDTNTGTIYKGGMLTYLDQFAAKNILESTYHLPVAILNDGKAAALAEFATGNLKGVTNGMAIVVGTGLGCGLVINGQLYQGSHFQAGELTFMYPAKDDRLTQKDLAGQQTSAVGMIKECAETLSLADTTDGKTVFSYLNAKDTRVYPIFERYCRYLAIYIMNVQAVLDVERVVLSGGISSQPILLDELNRQLNRLETEEGLVFKVVDRPELLCCKHNNRANLIGAAYFLATERH